MKKQKTITIKQLFKRHEYMRFVFYNEFTSILRQPLGLEHYTIGIKCSSDEEETFIEQVAASHIGNPNIDTGLVLSGNISKDRLFDKMDVLRDVTLHINKTHLMHPDLKKDIWRIAHDNSHCNLMVTCDGGLLSYRHSEEDKARSIVIDVPPLTDFDIGGIRSSICNNYGHLIEPFMKLFFENKDSINDWYNASCENLLKDITHLDPHKNIIGRQADYFASAEIAGILLENVYQEVGFDRSDRMDPRKVTYKAWKDFVASDWAVHID